jgi:hypothetical protein
LEYPDSDADADDSGRCVSSGVLREQLFDLPLGDAADFDAFCAASLAAQESNSGYVRFQKAGEEFNERLVGAVFQGGSLQANLNGSGYFAGDFIVAGAGLDAHGKSHCGVGGVFNDV